MALPDSPRMYESDRLPPNIEAVNKIVVQPFFGCIPSSVKFAIYYSPSRLWIYGDRDERNVLVQEQRNRWDSLFRRHRMTSHERAIAMGYGGGSL